MNYDIEHAKNLCDAIRTVVSWDVKTVEIWKPNSFVVDVS